MNRGDLLSVYGIAREVAALYGTELRPMPGQDPAVGSEDVSIQIDDLEGCPRYIGRVFRGVARRPVAGLAARAARTRSGSARSRTSST